MRKRVEYSRRGPVPQEVVSVVERDTPKPGAGEVLANGSALVNYGAMAGEPGAVSPASLIFRGIPLRGFWLSWWYRQASPQTRMELFSELATLIAEGQLSARVQATYGIDEAVQAVAAAASGERDGKIVFLPNG